MSSAPDLSSDPAESGTNDLSDTLTYKCVLAGLVSASGRFVPIPFVDDVIRQRCSKFVVSQSLAASNSPTNLEQLKPIYGGGQGWLSGCFGLLLKVPLKLLLFPIRKLIAIVTSVRGVPIEVMRCVLLGRTVHRVAASETIDRTDAERIRVAFDQTMHRMDFRAIKAALLDTLRGVDSWKESAIDIARGVSKSSGPVRTELAPENPARNGARQITQMMERPETLRLFAEFDRRFDENLKRVDATPTS